MEEKRANWEPGIEDLAYLAHLWMHTQIMSDNACHICTRYPLPKQMQDWIDRNNQRNAQGYQDAEVVDPEGDF